jgi:hypothetical protein
MAKSANTLKQDADMKIHRSFPVTFFIIFLLLTVGCAGGGQYVPIAKQSLKGWGGIILYPFGRFSIFKAQEI